MYSQIQKKQERKQEVMKDDGINDQWTGVSV